LSHLPRLCQSSAGRPFQNNRAQIGFLYSPHLVALALRHSQASVLNPHKLKQNKSYPCPDFYVQKSIFFPLSILLKLYYYSSFYTISQYVINWQYPWLFDTITSVGSIMTFYISFVSFFIEIIAVIK